jgi:putative addiction module killer protein
VEAIRRELRLYTTSTGVCPFEVWLGRLRDAKGRAQIQVRLDRLEQGNLGDSKPIGDGLKELRIDVGPGYRVYFAEDGPRIVLLLIGGDKSSQSTNIKSAKKFWLDYKERTR